MPQEKNSAYWKEEITVTQDYMASLVHGDIAGVKSTKSSDDVLQMQDIDKEMDKCRKYLAYCNEMYKKAIDEENGTKDSTKSILYFNRETGY